VTAAVTVAPGPAPQGAPSAPPTEYRSTWEHVAFYLFTIVPFLAVFAGMGLWWAGVGFSALTVGLALFFYVLTGLGITVGYHRLLTHRAFTAPRWLRLGLAVTGSMAIQGGVLRWVADHRKHHQYSDKENDPHSPWRYGSGWRNLGRGLWWAHTGWLFQREQAVKAQYAPDLTNDPDMCRVHALFPLWVALSVLMPPVIALALTQSWSEAAQTLLWASLVRIFLLHHVTFSINSLCHVIGKRPYETRDRSSNVSFLALLSFGESWHNLHHAQPNSARHGIGRGQIDISAGVIRGLERVGVVTGVHWPDKERLDRRKLRTNLT
jgi:stearoyl-CoA desaturase (Delta-9 desaturase)